MSTIEELRKQRRDLNRQLRETNRAERRAVATTERDRARKAMLPERLEIENKLDTLYASVFTSENGQQVLLHLTDIRPVVADMIKERLERHAAKANADTGNNQPTE